MTAMLRCLTVLGVLAASTGAAAARPIQIADDPPPPPPPPDNGLPTAPVRAARDHAVLAYASASMAYVSDATEPLARFGPGGELGILHLSHQREPGFELVARAPHCARGTGYAASARLLVTARLRPTDLARPFLALGAAFAIDRLEDDGGKEVGAGLGLGPSAAIGLHGFLSERVYWRAQAQMVGAGIGMFTTDASLGWVLGS